MAPVTREDLQNLLVLMDRASPPPWFVDAPFHHYGRWRVGASTSDNPDDAKLIALLRRCAPSLIRIAQERLDAESASGGLNRRPSTSDQ